MPRKSKKHKKPKKHSVEVLQAEEIENYIRLKFGVDDNGFWTWFFSECPWGETNILGLNDEDDIIQPKFKEYFNVIKKEFLPDADQEGCIEIKNDL